MTRSVYLHDIPLAEAQHALQSALRENGLWAVLGKEELPLSQHLAGRVLADAVWAINSSPHYHASAMDGFAVRAEATSAAMPTTPVALLCEDDAKYVDTGDPLPGWANAVIPIENVEALDTDGNMAKNPRAPQQVRIRAAVVPWSHVRPMGEDIVATQLVLPAGHTLNAFDLGAIAASGHQTAWVARKPRVAILPTGTELVPIGTPLKAGDILEYNSLVISGQLQAMGAEPMPQPITIDDLDLICQRVKDASANCDMVLLNAGSSAGSEDFSSRVVERLGQLLVHGVAVRPGHPVILGMLKRDDPLRPMIPIVGVPGYPVSAALTVEIFVEPIISQWLGRPAAQPESLEAAITRKTVSPPGDDDFVRVVLGKVDGKMLCAPISRGAGVITSMVRADGLVVLPRGVQGVDAGDTVTVRLIKPRAELEQTIFCIGSHDVILDLVAQFLAAKGRRFVSSNVGSQGGLVALRRGEAHLAGSHLIDPDSGEYNIKFIQQYLPDVPVRAVGLVMRQQGLIVAKGNPFGLHGLEDLTRADVHFINRQRGAGTRVLLDMHLAKAGIGHSAVNGYANEEYTHLGVAAAVASGRASCGMGIPSAAQALGLDFVPLYQERYDLVIPHRHAESALLQPLMDLLNDDAFRKAIEQLPGYDTGVMGKVTYES